MTMNLKKVSILTSFDHRLFALPAFCGLFSFQSLPFGELSYYIKNTHSEDPPDLLREYISTSSILFQLS